MKFSFFKCCLLVVTVSLFSCKKDTPADANCGSSNDIDGNTYNAVKIGTQCWMKSNLNVSHYRNGDTIPEVQDAADWLNLTTGAWCYYENVSANGTVYGKLYNWYAVNDPRGLAPAGWHCPTDSEWTTLTDYLGDIFVAADKMKEAGTVHWSSITGNTANNSSGFTALPGGYRLDYNGGFAIMGQNAFWWSSTQTTNGIYAYNRYIQDHIERDAEYKVNGFSVRCIKD